MPAPEKTLFREVSPYSQEPGETGENCKTGVPGGLCPCHSHFCSGHSDKCHSNLMLRVPLSGKQGRFIEAPPCALKSWNGTRLKPGHAARLWPRKFETAGD